MVFRLSFHILADFLSKCYRNHRTTCWKMTMAWGEKIFHEFVAYVCLTFGTVFLVVALNMAIAF